MKITVEQLYEVMGSVTALAQHVKLSAAPSLKVRRVYRALKQLQDDAEEQRQALVGEYAARDEAGALVLGAPGPGGQPTTKIDSARMDGWQKAIGELLEAELEVAEHFTPSDFAGAETTPGSPVGLGAILIGLGALLVE